MGDRSPRGPYRSATEPTTQPAPELPQPPLCTPTPAWGRYNATLTVTNQAGLSSTTTATIEAQPSPPVPTLTASPPGGLAPVDNVSFDGSATT